MLARRLRDGGGELSCSVGVERGFDEDKRSNHFERQKLFGRGKESGIPSPPHALLRVKMGPFSEVSARSVCFL